MRTPLQVIVIRDPNNHRTDVYVDTLRLAFEGSAAAVGSPSAYLDDAVDLGVRVLEPMEGINFQEAERLVGGAQHTVVVKIGGSLSLRLEIFIRLVGNENIVWVPEPLEPNNDEVQGEQPSDGVEQALAPVITALQAMQKSRRILAYSVEDEATAKGSLNFFISHAKVDGVAFAQSLIGILQQLKVLNDERLNFNYFYDFEHLKPGVVWREVLKTQATQSVLVALRTEAYESRIWCRREYLWAEQNGMPILVVDLRKNQYHDSALLPFDSAPTVRVHDGNLFRVVLHATAAHLRALRARSQAPIKVKVLPHRPSVYSLIGAMKSGQIGHLNKVAYPGPKLPEEYRLAVEPILVQGGKQLELVTFDEMGDN